MLEETFSLYGKITNLTNNYVKFQKTEATEATVDNPFKIIDGKLILYTRTFIN